MTLRVHYGTLEESASALRTLADEFAGLDDASDAVKDAVGHHGISRAIEAFANNWDRHRGELVDQLRGLEQATRTAIASWQDADESVARQLAVESPRPQHGPVAL
ncbi:hypothetical protein [Thalassiella azotivora]